MKAPLLKNIESQVLSVTIQELREPHFDPNWHFHPHYQLFTVLEGTGTRLIGDSIQPFEPGDTVFLGPDIPHLWRSDAHYFEPNHDLTTHGIVLYFQEDFLGKAFFNLPEMHAIDQFLKESKRGIEFRGEARQRVRTELLGLTQADGFERIVRLLALLNELAHSAEGVPITSYGYENNYKVSETERMQKVHTYVLQHFKEEIRLVEVASLAGMSEAAFCRYFKTRANKTFTDFVNEIRIGHACKLLQEDRWSVSQTAYESGFDTLSNFNRLFKKVTNQTPREYRKAYTGKA
ncbi:AraC family transcriptional regulator [Rhabdobacter roseus]|uniref:AraC-like DNA-binding protein n=1 Tax=Rhabdobacter roseus TaxID=1655419 RepID=A0A840TS76_9BACT|nr:AraC family transcriptional regulator [Rhabdobacter roseus]MBB5284557.1 AraC-like DNA-binding protein [Rhabdobacter roseus]